MRRWTSLFKSQQETAQRASHLSEVVVNSNKVAFSIRQAMSFVGSCAALSASKTGHELTDRSTANESLFGIGS